MSDHLKNLSKYNHWANRAIVNFLLDQEKDVLDDVLKSSFPTIRKTIFHIADAQFIWLARMNGTSPFNWPSAAMEDARALAALEETSHDFERYVNSFSEEQQKCECVFKALDGKEHRESRENIIMHCMNHSTFHRGQLITMFRQTGREDKMPRTDYIAYLREMEISL